MRMYICMCVHVYTHMHIYTYTHAYIHVCTCIYACVYMYCIRVCCMHNEVCIYIQHAYIHVCTCIYACMYMYCIRVCCMHNEVCIYKLCVIISSRVYSVCTLCASSLHCNSRLDSGSTSRKDELSGEHFQGKTNYTRATYVHNHSVSTGVQNVYLQTRVPTRAGDVVFQVHLNVVYFINITIFYKSTKK